MQRYISPLFVLSILSPLSIFADFVVFVVIRAYPLPGKMYVRVRTHTQSVPFLRIILPAFVLSRASDECSCTRTLCHVQSQRAFHTSVRSAPVASSSFNSCLPLVIILAPHIPLRVSSFRRGQVDRSTGNVLPRLCLFAHLLPCTVYTSGRSLVKHQTALRPYFVTRVSFAAPPEFLLFFRHSISPFAFPPSLSLSLSLSFSLSLSLSCSFKPGIVSARTRTKQMKQDLQGATSHRTSTS